MRSYFGDIVALQGIPQSLPGACTARLDATSVWAAAPLLSSLLPLLSHKILSLQTEILIVKKIKKTTNFDRNLDDHIHSKNIV